MVDWPHFGRTENSNLEGWSISHTENRQLTLRLGSAGTDTGQKAQGFWREEREISSQKLPWTLGHFSEAWITLEQGNTHVRVVTGNTTTVSCLNKQGLKSWLLNDLAQEIWQWCESKGIWISAAHIPAIENVEADKLSRDMHVDTEWKLDQALLHDTLAYWTHNPPLTCLPQE